MEFQKDAIQDVVKRFTTELLDVIQHNDRMQDGEGTGDRWVECPSL